MPEHEHEVVFIGMVNVNRDNYLQGVVDVWRCRGCGQMYCDDKRYNEPLAPSVGFQALPEDEQWGILTCTTPKEVYMASMGVKPGKTLTHACRNGDIHEFLVKADYSLEPDLKSPIHRVWLVKDNVNKNIEAGIYRLTMK